MTLRRALLAVAAFALCLALGLWWVARGSETPTEAAATTSAERFVKALAEKNASGIEEISVTRRGDPLDEKGVSQVISKYGGADVELVPGSVHSEFVGRAIFTVKKGEQQWIFGETWSESKKGFQVEVDKTF